ncbi:MAG: hypothetical protein IJS88_02435 [Alphaproteobacteria bacterium]|nr:hypothetical protein [Alphaproteobacteria bacterium]
MKQLNLEDIRTALYEMNIPAVRNFPEETLKNADFWFDLGMDERNVIYLISNLEMTKRVKVPALIWDSLKEKNTVYILLHAVNAHIIDLDKQ